MSDTDTNSQIAEPAAAPVPEVTPVPATAPAESTGVAVAEAAPATVTVGKKAKKQDSGDLIMDIAVEVEGLTKSKALNLASTLSENVEVSYFKLGGVLKVIKDNSWFDGSADFETFVFENYGFQARKAAYLIQIYTDLVSKQIPWEKVAGLGWTKLKDLSPILTAENVDEWVAKASKLTVAELQNILKATKDGADSTSTKTTDDLVKLKYNAKTDQATTIQTAIAKAKGELGTEFDTVALENICASYLAGNTGVVQTVDTSSLDAFIKSVDFMTLLSRVAELSPEWDITVDKAKTAEATAAAA